MTALVRFRASEREYALDLTRVARVERADAIEPLPDPRPGVAGLLRRPEGSLPVLAAFGAGSYVLVVEATDRRFGLVVEDVRGIERLDESAIEPPPDGQRTPLVTGMVRAEGWLGMLLDADALARKLDA